MAYPDFPDPTRVLVTKVGILVITFPNGNAEADADIATTLGVASLPYTSNDANAQTLIPAGWTWSSAPRDSGMHYCIRDSDGKTTGDIYRCDPDTGLAGLFTPPVSLALGRCIAAITARWIDIRDTLYIS